MAKTALQIVQAVLVLLDKPEAWTKGALARASDGKSFSPEDPEAVCFCLVGGLEREGNWPESTSDDTTAYLAVKRAIGHHVPGVLISDFNDALVTEHRHVIAVLREAVMDLEANP